MMQHVRDAKVKGERQGFDDFKFVIVLNPGFGRFEVERRYH